MLIQECGQVYREEDAHTGTPLGDRRRLEEEAELKKNQKAKSYQTGSKVTMKKQRIQHFTNHVTLRQSCLFEMFSQIPAFE